MTADEIRAVENEAVPNDAAHMADVPYWLREIAAQLAELNTHMKSIADTVYADGMAKYGQ